MKLACVHGVNDLRIDDAPVPSPGPRDALVRVKAVGICGSDLGFVKAGGLGGVEPLPGPLPLGHEFAGVIESVGAEVTGISVGDRVAVNPDEGLIGTGGPGAMAPFVLVRGARLGASIFPIPDHLPMDVAALAEPLSVALHGINLARITPASRVVVLGAGPIGLSAVVCLRHRGVTDIVAVDLSDSRLELAARLGASLVINSGRQSMSELLARAHGSGTRFGMAYVGTDLFIDAAGAAQALDEAVRVAKYRTQIVVIALYKAPFPLSLWKLMANEISITGSIALMRDAEFQEVVELLGSGLVDVSALISHRVDFSECERAFAIAADTESAAKVILTF